MGEPYRLGKSAPPPEVARRPAGVASCFVARRLLLCDNIPMQNKIVSALTTLFLAALLSLSAFAQQSTPSSGQSSTPGSAPKSTAAPATGTKSAQTPAKKPGSSAARAATPFTLKTDKDKNSYAVGMYYANDLKQKGLDLESIDPAVLARAIKDAFAASGKTLLTPDEQKALLTQLTTVLRAKQQAKAQQLAAANKTAGDAFLADNKTKEGVVTLPSGLQYKVLQQGTGPKPTPDDSVVCNYRGTLLDGTEFDSSYKRGEPATFPVKGVIKGWTEALPLMPVGSKWQLFIPSDLAYGERGAGQQIGPNSTLVFEVELLSIQPPKSEPEAKPAAPPSSQPSQPQTSPATQPQGTPPPQKHPL